MVERPDADAPTGSWTDAVADRDGLRCEWCDGPIARTQLITTDGKGHVMHRGCLEDQPTQVHQFDDPFPQTPLKSPLR
jgi:hypothetical protein